MKYRIVKEDTGRYRIETKRFLESWKIYSSDERGYYTFESYDDAEKVAKEILKNE